MGYRTSIWVTFDFEGYHQWAEAPEDKAFLRSKHRHLFKGKVTMEVFHGNREVEFFSLRSECLGYIRELDLENVGSCEMIAGTLLQSLMRSYPGRAISVEISEDGENGAIVSNANIREPSHVH